MKINEMFVKDVDRDIQGVIIAGQGDDDAVANELDEYVVTRELEKHFSDFFAAYKRGIIGTTPKMGVWISGFFGSGKSLLLKIFAYLLQNRMAGGKRALDYFIEGGKIIDKMVLADMQLAADTPADVILFNIDAKSEARGKHDNDAIVRVFLRVFNEMQGFCGSMPHLADLEQRLTQEGRYDDFKAAFEARFGKTWDSSWQHFDFIQDTVVLALSDIGFMSEAAARNWCAKAKAPYQISIEDFAKRVKDYIDRKGGNHHVVFCVDEIGQYIGDDSKLMLNLQTVTEELGRVCGGKAWVIVTSQQDIDSITKVKGNDFSKIQGRFDTRLSLSSANVDAVIKKRLLSKTETAADTLRLLYEQNATVIKNKIAFDGGAEKKLYANGDDFAEVYPFVPYQFNLLASTLTSIRTHGASGKHLSEGERSMLGLFREAAMQISDEDSGAFVPFYSFYDGLENFLDHSHKGVISRAYDNSVINPDKKRSDVFAINVLKTLFLIKYVLEIVANLDSITSLMITSLDDDRVELKDRVEDALKVLIHESLVQPNGSIYVFLTDEEQEIDREIKAQNVEMNEVISKAAEMIYEGIFTDKRYRHPAFNGRYAFGFNQYVDEHPHRVNSSNEISLRILTPWYEGVTEDTTLRHMSAQGKEVLVALPNDAAFLEEVRSYLQIEKYLSKNTTTQLPKYETIKEGKRKEMRDRLDNATTYLKENLKDASIYVNGNLARVNAKEPASRINEAIGRLVQTVFHKLSYIDAAMGEADIRKLLRSSNQVSIDLGAAKPLNQHALDDLRSYISGNSRIHMKTSMKTVKERLMKAPYGFVEDDVHWLVTKLFRDGVIDFTVNGAAVSRLNKSEDELVNFITKKQFVEKLLLDEHATPDDAAKKAVRDVMKVVFHVSSASDDDDTMMKNFQRYCESTITTIERQEAKYEKYAYPGKKVLDSGKKLMQSVSQIQDRMEFYQAVKKRKDDFLDFSEDYEPIRSFFDGEQRGFFERACDMLGIYEDSKTYIVDKDLEDIVAQMRRIVRMENPYGEIHKLPELRNRFMNAYMKVLKVEQAPVLDSIEQDCKRVMDVLRTKEYAAQKNDAWFKMFREIKDGAEHCNNVSILRSFGDKANALKLRLLNEMDNIDADLAEKKAIEEKERREREAKKEGTNPPVEIKPPVIKKKKTKNVSIKTMAKTASWRLESEKDIDGYLAALRQSLLSELSENDVVNVEL